MTTYVIGGMHRRGRRRVEVGDDGVGMKLCHETSVYEIKHGLDVGNVHGSIEEHLMIFIMKVVCNGTLEF